MTDGTLPEDLLRLDQALSRRPQPAPPAWLRSRVVAEVRWARVRERGSLLLAAAAVVLFVVGMRASMPPDAAGPALTLQELEVARLEALALERLGLDPQDARRTALAARLGGVPRIAPPLGSRTGTDRRQEGL